MSMWAKKGLIKSAEKKSEGMSLVAFFTSRQLLAEVCFKVVV